MADIPNVTNQEVNQSGGLDPNNAPSWKFERPGNAGDIWSGVLVKKGFQSIDLHRIFKEAKPLKPKDAPPSMPIDRARVTQMLSGESKGTASESTAEKVNDSAFESD